MSEESKLVPTDNQENSLVKVEEERSLVKREEQELMIPDDERPSKTSGPRHWVYFVLVYALMALILLILVDIYRNSKQQSQALIDSGSSVEALYEDYVSQIGKPQSVLVEQTENDVTLRIHSITKHTRYTSLDISVINEGNQPVNFLGMMTAQLIDEKGKVYNVDFSTASSFVTVNPSARVRATIRFTEPIAEGTQMLTLVVNNVGSLNEKWYYEVPFELEN